MRAAAVVSVFGALSILLAVPAGATAAPSDDDELRVVLVDADHGPDVTVDVIVPQRSTGRTLPATSFQVVEDGTPVTVSATRLNPGDLDVMIAFGWPPGSGSDVVPTFQAATTELVRMLPDGARVGIADAAGRATTPLTSDRSGVLGALEQLAVGPVGSVAGAVSEAANALRAQGSRRPAIVVLTEQGDVDSATLGRVVEDLESDPSPMVTLVMASTAPSAELNSLELPGGGTAIAVTHAGLIGATDAVVADLVGRYRLSFHLTDPGATEVAVRLADGGVVSEAAVPIASSVTGGAAAAPAPRAEPAEAVVPSDGTRDRVWPVLLTVGVLLLAGSGFAGVWVRRQPGSELGVIAPAGTTGLVAPAGAIAVVQRPPAVVLLGDAGLGHDVAQRLGGDGGDATSVDSALDALREILVRPQAVLVVEAGLPRVDDLVRTLRGAEHSDRDRVTVVAVTNDEVLDLPVLELADRIVETAGGSEGIATVVDEAVASSEPEPAHTTRGGH